MPRFSYSAYDARGQLAGGQITAATRREALEALHRDGATPLDLVEIGDAVAADTPRSRRVLRRRGARRWLTPFTRDIAALLGAGITLEDALRVLSEQPGMPAPWRRALQDVLERVLSGATLADAMRLDSALFPASYCEVIEAAERGGHLASAFSALCNDLEREETLVTELRNATIYPLIVLLAAVIALALLVGVLVPTLSPLFDEAGIKQPAMIAFLSGLRRLFSSPLTWFLPLGLGIAAAVLVSRDAVKHTATCHKLLLKVPVLHSLIRRRETVRFTGTLAVLLQNGVPLLDAIRTAGDVNTNTLYREAARAAERRIATGGRLSDAMAVSGLYDPLALRMVAVGEQTGQLHRMLGRLREIEDAALQRELKGLITWIAPSMTILVGLLVGTIVLSVMGAIVALNEVVL